MAIVNGTEYEFIDLQQASGGNTTRHMLRDAQARGDISSLKSALVNGGAIINVANYDRVPYTISGSNTVTRSQYDKYASVQIPLDGYVGLKLTANNSKNGNFTFLKEKLSADLSSGADITTALATGETARHAVDAGETEETTIPEDAAWMIVTVRSNTTEDTSIPALIKLYMPINVEMNNKQDQLTFDSAPTEGSTNPVTSGGVYTEISALKADVDPVKGIASLIGNVPYWGEPDEYIDEHPIRINVHQSGERITFNNTSPTAETSTVKLRYYRINGGISFMTKSQQDEDDLRLALVAGHQYKLIVRKVSGTITGNNCFIYVKNSATTYTGEGASARIDLLTMGNSQETVFIAPSGNVNIQMYVASETLCTNLTLDIYLIDLSISRGTFDASDICYISPSGDDGNTGTEDAPKATVNAALAAGAEHICMMPGKYAQTIDLSLSKTGAVDIFNHSLDSNVYIYGPDHLIAESATLVSGYTKVYQAEYTKTKTPTTQRCWIFQDNVADETTVIASYDRMAIQRGRRTRCGDTKIIACTSETKTEALAEIENADVYKFYYSSSDGAIYFSCPETVSANHPICSCFDTGVFVNGGRNTHLTMTGITVKYNSINLSGMSSPIVSECHAANVCGNGAFTWDSASGTKLFRCEAERTFKGVIGDGFNAHSVTTGEASAPQTSAMMFDCWSHDNQDDGYSDHERCITSIFGGLYEYNAHGGGVTPANGSHCTCYNVYSRHNVDGGFRCAGNPTEAEGGIGTSLDCFGCVSDSNGTYGWTYTSSNNQGKLVNCIAMNESVGFNGASGAKIEMDNCSTVNCATQKSGSATFAINTGIAVT